MPIHDQGYRRYAGRRRPAGTAWWVIARQQISTVLSQKRYLILLLLAWVPFVGRVVQIYLAANFQQASFLATSAQLFRGFLDQQGLFVFLLIVGASGAIADDRRANALQVYLSKPLTRVEYIAGKLFAPLAFVLGVTLLPALLLLVVHVAFSGSLTFVIQNLYLLPAIVLYSVVLALVGTFTMVALSSLSKSRRFTALTFTGLFFFTTAMYHVQTQSRRALTLIEVVASTMIVSLMAVAALNALAAATKSSNSRSVMAPSPRYAERLCLAACTGGTKTPASTWNLAASAMMCALLSERLPLRTSDATPLLPSSRPTSAGFMSCASMRCRSTSIGSALGVCGAWRASKSSISRASVSR